MKLEEFIYYVSSPRQRQIVVRISPDGSGEVEHQRYDDNGWTTVYKIWVAPGEILPPQYVRRAAALGYVSQEVVAQAEEQARLDQPVPADVLSAFDVLPQRIAVTVGDVEHALRSLDAHRARYDGRYYIQDPDGEYICWGGLYVSEHAVRFVDFLDAGGRLDADIEADLGRQ